MTESLAEQVARLGRPRLLVVGDVILDRYVWGQVDRISPEAPIQVLDVTNEEYRPGGAGNVAVNLARLEAEVRLLGVVGGDGESQILLELLREQGVDTDLVTGDPERPTTVKTRMIAHGQQVLRVDRERRSPIGPAIRPRLSAALDDALTSIDAVLVSDYSKGLLAPDFLAEIFERAAVADVPVLVDPKGTDFERYRGAYLLTPNRVEAERVLGVSLEDDLETLGEGMRKDLDLPALIITLGPGGISVFREGRRPLVVPAVARAVYDVSGAGDTVLAAIGLCIGSGVDLEDAVRIANAAGGIVVGKVGTAQVTRQELIDSLLRPSGLGHVKILARTEAARALEEERRIGRRIVFTNGCFDLLHPGHLSTFEFCRKRGDVVVVGVNSDASVGRLKGPGRPILDQEERQRLLAGLADVDYVVLFDEDTPAGLIDALRPDVLVKGADWRGKEVVGRQTVEAGGGEVAFCPLVEGIGTSDIIERVRQRLGQP